MTDCRLNLTSLAARPAPAVGRTSDAERRRRRAGRLGRCSLLAMVIACGSAHSPPAPPAAPPPDRDHVEEIADVEDRCPWLPRECFEGFDPNEDIDGCPDPEPIRIAVSPADTPLTADAQRILDGVAEDASHLVAGATIVIVAESAPDEAETDSAQRAARVERALLDRGVPAGRVRVAPPGPVSLEAEDPDPHLVAIRTEGCLTQTR